MDLKTPSDSTINDNCVLIIDPETYSRWNASEIFEYKSYLTVEDIKSCIKECNTLIYRYLLRIIIISFVMLMNLYFHGIILYVSDSFYITTSKLPLKDRIHDIFENVNHPFTHQFCDVLMFVFFFLVLFRIMFFTPLIYFFQNILRYLTIYGSGYFIRALFIYITTVPGCVYPCEPDLSKKTFFQFLERTVDAFRGHITVCSDMIVSGHTIFTVITCILIVDNVKSIILKGTCIAYTIFILFSIIASKYHYTIDVIMGTVIAICLKHYYMTKLDAYGVYFVNRIENPNNTQLEKNKKSMLFGSFLAKLIVSMELLEERLILGQKLRILYLYVNSKPNVIDEKLKNKFNHYVRLFGADESDDLLTLYRGTRMFNFYYWKYFYCKIFKKQNAVVL